MSYGSPVRRRTSSCTSSVCTRRQRAHAKDTAGVWFVSMPMAAPSCLRLLITLITRRSAVSPDSFCAKLQGFAFSPISSLIGLMLIPMAICLMILHPLLPLLSCLGKLLSILTCEYCCSESSCETNVQFSDYVDLLAIAGAMVFSPFTSFYTLFLHCTYGGSAK